jgi:hypothetical protein
MPFETRGRGMAFVRDGDVNTLARPLGSGGIGEPALLMRSVEPCESGRRYAPRK